MQSHVSKNSQNFNYLQASKPSSQTVNHSVVSMMIGINPALQCSGALAVLGAVESYYGT